MVRLSRLGIVAWAMALFAVALLAKAAQVQLWQGDAWAARAVRQQVAGAALPAPRGEILDGGGVPLAQSRQLVQLHVAPREVRNRRALARELAQLGLARGAIAMATSTKRVWVTIPGRHLPVDVASLLAMRGVYADAAIERLYSASESARWLIGHVDASGAPVDGVELALDSVLRGESGRGSVLRDGGGGRFESPTVPGVAPRAGHTVTLTLNRALQDISERALADAAAKTGADGGDIVVLDPHEGTILALASRRAERTAASPALTEPFEPGSTLKPIIAGALLSHGRARPDEVISTHGGTLTVEKRTITDVHQSDSLSLRDVIRWSSNVGIVGFAERLTPREKFEALRDYGFGGATGVSYPTEANGTLRHPRAWSRQSSASLAMGYEIAVTPLQLALAYAAIANGGELLEPVLVREIRDAEGEVTYRHRRRVVRRVVAPAVAAELRGMLADVVARGTAVEADLATFVVGGKSGTARRTSLNQGYVPGAYTATYVGLFPAEKPQFVILVKLDNPRGGYFGGKTAAPVSRAVLQAALAARDAALDRGALARVGRRVAPRSSFPTPPGSFPAEGAELTEAQAAQHGGGAYFVALGARHVAPPPVTASRAVPDVRGLPLRAAVHSLHRAGFRVQLASGGAADGDTFPAAGTSLRPGALVRLRRSP